MSERPKVFLSFAVEDHLLGEAVGQKLGELAVEVRLKDDLAAAKDWANRLPSVLREVDHFVFIATEASLNSPWLLPELGAAWALGKTIVAVVSDSDVLQRIPASLEPSHVIRPTDLARLADVLLGTPDEDVPAEASDLSQLQQEIVKVRARRRSLSADEWNTFIEGAKSDLWLFGIAEWGYAKDPRVPPIFKAAATHGCDIRVLLLDPESPAAEAIERAELKQPELLKLRIHDALRSYSAMAEACQGRMQIRTYHVHPTVSVVRADERALITHYLAPLQGDDSPMFEITRIENGVFDRYVEHFEAVWQSARSAPRILS